MCVECPDVKYREIGCDEFCGFNYTVEPGEETIVTEVSRKIFKDNTA